MGEVFCSNGQMIGIGDLDRPLPKDTISGEIMGINPQEGSALIRIDGTLTSGQNLLLLGISILCDDSEIPVFGGFLMPFFKARAGDDLVPTWDRCLWNWSRAPQILIQDQVAGDILVFRKLAE